MSQKCSQQRIVFPQWHFSQLTTHRVLKLTQAFVIVRDPLDKNFALFPCFITVTLQCTLLDFRVCTGILLGSRSRLNTR